MEAHRIGEARQEEVVILGSQCFHDGRQTDPFDVGQIRHPLNVSLLRNNHCFVGPSMKVNRRLNFGFRIF